MFINNIEGNMNRKNLLQVPDNSLIRRVKYFLLLLLVLMFALITGNLNSAVAQDVLTAQDIMNLKTCSQPQISPDGKWIAYTLRQARDMRDTPGPDYSELYLLAVETGEIKPFVTGKVNVSAAKWSSDGSQIGFIMRRGEGAAAPDQVWMISRDGGEAVQVTASKTGVIDFKWENNALVYIAGTPDTPREKKLKEQGFNFIFYEENIKSRNLYRQNTGPVSENTEVEQLTRDLSIWDFIFSADGKFIVFSASDQNLIDQQYMFRSIYALDLQHKTVSIIKKNPWKLGNYSLSPAGSYLAYTAGLDSSDQAVSQIFYVPVQGGAAVNLTIPDFRGHVEWAGWLDNENLFYRSAEGVWTTLRTVNRNGGNRKVLLDTKNAGVVFDNQTCTADHKKFVMTGSAANTPGDIYYWEPGKNIKRMTTVNPWLEQKKLGEQLPVKYNARDGLEIEGILIYPVGYQQGIKYPLVVYVHGGPEAHYSNSWLSRYANPGQVFAGLGYFVFYPNYRASTGYGYTFSKAGYGDPAGKEFDDIADGIDFLVKQGLVDAGRVALAGGSYGGYAAAWFGTFYTKYVKAVHMSVGISDLISKRSTTDIPWEDLYVHMGKSLEEAWEFNLQRSPIYWTRQSQTAFLICGGTNDTRVHPGQSLELYHRLKMNDHPAVRYMQYPGEGHGNSKQTSKIDFLYRQIEWFNWYVRDNKPLSGPMPPLDISDLYGLPTE